jgi:hypothetical protein
MLALLRKRWRRWRRRSASANAIAADAAPWPRDAVAVALLSASRPNAFQTLPRSSAGVALALPCSCNALASIVAAETLRPPCPSASS